MRRSSSGKNHPFQRTSHLRSTIVIVQFGVISELVDDKEAVHVPYDREHESCPRDVMSQLYHAT
jgi:hypothetical protein